jgi:hypothetical protein
VTPPPLRNLGFHSVGSRSDLLSLAYAGIEMGEEGVRGGRISRGVEAVDGDTGDGVLEDDIGGVMRRMGLAESLWRHLRVVDWC